MARKVISFTTCIDLQLVPRKRMVFGRPLEEQRDKVGEVPLIIVQCCEFILQHGINIQGTLRRSGSATDIEWFTLMYDEGSL